MNRLAMIAVAVVLLLLFGYIGLRYDSAALASFDRHVSDSFAGWASDGWTSFFGTVTVLGSSVAMVPIFLVAAAVFMFRYKFKQETLALLCALLVAKLLNEAIKALVQRARPAWEHLAEADGYSFPSGHAMVSIAFYGMLAYVLARRAGRGAIAVAVAAALLELLIGASRIYLQVHFATDVIGGYAAGAFWLLVCIGGLRLWERRRSAAD